MRLLLVPYYFAPAGGPRSIRWTNLARYLAQRGHDLTVVAADFPIDCPWMDPSLLEVVQGLSIDIQRIPVPACSPTRRENLMWAKAVSAWLRKRGTEGFDAVISSAVPIASHVVAGNLKRRPDAPWIADYGDPWSQSASRTRRAPVRLAETIYERRLLQRADALTITAESARPAFEAVFPHPDRIHVIPQGASHFHLSADWSSPPPPSSRLRVLYTGGFYQGVREPTALIEGLRQVEEVELTIVGHSQMDLMPLVEAAGLSDRVRILPYADIKEVVRMQQEADMLLLLSWPVAEQIPGKFYEYMATSRPILYATFHPDDAIATALREHGAGRVTGPNAEDMAQGLLEAARDHRSGRPFWREPAVDAGFDARAVAFERLIERLREERSR